MIHLLIRFGLILVACTAGTVLTASAQDIDREAFYTCLRQVGSVVRPYDQVEPDGAIGAYRFNLNHLFTAGFCTGSPPPYVSYDWRLCNFKGPAAVANRITTVAALLRRPDVQNKVLDDLIVKKSIAHKDLLLDSDLHAIQTYNNGPDVFGGLLYRKGAAATRLLALTDINGFDRLGYSMRSYVKFYGTCAGSNRVSATRRLYDAKPDETNTNTPLRAQPSSSTLQSLAWQPLSSLPADSREQLIRKVPELRVVLGPTERHLFAPVALPSTTGVDMLVRLAGVDFCNSQTCTYYLFRNNFRNVIIFYAGDVRLAPGQNGFYIDGFYKSLDALGNVQ